MKIYQATIVPLNEQVIGTAAHGTALFTINGDTLTINIEMFDTPANLQHWEHFHGFPDGKAADIATSAQDVNHDVVLPDTVAGAVGHYSTHVTLPIAVGKIVEL
nr:hypothetical protein [Levilactobacillus lanxiensis]